ncbi:hypothetical protein QVD17_37766 [Tagetes erecta]|uniref:Transposase-associated domain-containing protein n=1 Tax=Tagetes erecta TaxID=13708 RepID=A0AAD8K153_TARER|nr:hypothetical protein QVD17_37766 [Tagetes erecta]
MYKMTNSDKSFNMEYSQNLKKWLDFVYFNDLVVDRRVTKRDKLVLDIKCPCLRCQNSFFRDRETIHKHLLMKGFMSDYNTWSEHGEPSIHEVRQSSTTREGDYEVNDDDDGGRRRMVLDNMYSSEFTTPPHSNLDSTTP